MKTTLTLNWKELSIYDSNSLKDNVSGVYIWGFRINDGFTPYYVGIARHVQYRIAEHLNSIISGKYTIYNKDVLANFVKYKYEKVRDNILFIPDWPTNFYDFLERRDELSEHIGFMIDSFEFTYSEYKENEGEVSLKEVEKYMISLIGKENLANTRGGDSIVDLIHNQGDSEVIEFLNAKNKKS